MIKEKHEAGPQTKTLSIMTNLNSLDPVILVLIPVVLLYILFALAAFYTYQNIKQINQQHKNHFEAWVITQTSQEKSISDLFKSDSYQDKCIKDALSSVDIINAELFKPLYEVGNIVDFTHKDYPENLTGKIVKINTFSGRYPDYTVEVEAGITYNIYQSQIVAWTN